MKFAALLMRGAALQAQPAAEAEVFLIPWPKRDGDKVRRVSADQKGGYRMAGLAPGEYRILAVASSARERADEPAATTSAMTDGSGQFVIRTTTPGSYGLAARVEGYGQEALEGSLATVDPSTPAWKSTAFSSTTRLSAAPLPYPQWFTQRTQDEAVMARLQRP